MRCTAELQSRQWQLTAGTLAFQLSQPSRTAELQSRQSQWTAGTPCVPTKPSQLKIVASQRSQPSQPSRNHMSQPRQLSQPSCTAAVTAIAVDCGCPLRPNRANWAENYCKSTEPKTIEPIEPAKPTNTRRYHKALHKETLTGWPTVGRLAKRLDGNAAVAVDLGVSRFP